MNEEIKFSRKDLVVSLVVGEISAWLIWALVKGLLPADKYIAFVGYLKLLPIVFPVACLLGLYIGYLLGKKIAIVYQIAKFAVIGGFNTLVDWGVLSLVIFIFRQSFAIEAGDNLLMISSLTVAFYSLFKAISFVVAATNGYFWNKFWTFKRESTEKMSKEFLQFFVITFFGFLINVAIASGIFKYITPPLGLNSDQWGIVAAVVATAISMVWNFLGYKFIVFEQKRMPAAPIVPNEPPERKII
ncbi:MAG: GtrA family protein [bacterium]